MLDNHLESDQRKIRGVVVPPTEPRKLLGCYWGYTVRLANSLSDAITGGKYEYDLTIGTSERGTDINETNLPNNFSHALIVIGGVKGLEYSLEGDIHLEVDKVEDLFDKYLNVCPKQGSRTIRTEEAILIILSALHPKILTR